MNLTSEEWLQSIWAALRRIEDNMALPPAPLELPPITVPAPDLTDVVETVNQLKPGATAHDIAEALADVLRPGVEPPAGERILGDLAEQIKLLNHRIQGIGAQAYGGGSVSLLPGQTVGVNNWGEMPAATLTGAWSYYAGTAGTVNVAAGQRVIGIAAHATTAGSVSIGGGATIPLPANSGIAFAPQGNLVGPVAVVFTGTDSYAVDVLA